MKRTKKPDARPPPRLDWVKDPNAPVYPSESKSINYAAFKKTIEGPTLLQVMDKLRTIEALCYRLRDQREPVLTSPPKIHRPKIHRRSWWSRTLRLLFMPWAAE